MVMEKQQAEKVAQAILDPELKAQAEKQIRLQEREAQILLKRRRSKAIAPFLLVGSVLGVIAAQFMGVPFHRGLIAGALLGGLLGFYRHH